MIDFAKQAEKNRQKKQMEREREKAWEAELREKARTNPDAMTDEEKDALNDLTENFVGDYIDKEAEGKYYKLKELASELMNECCHVKRLQFNEPHRNHMVAMIYIDMGYVFGFEKKALSIFREMVNLADSITIATSAELDNARMTFMVCDVWRKK